MDAPRERERSPFVGPRPIETGELLFGREREERDLAALLIAKRIVLLHSPSGAGKSSLVNAALIPALRAKHFQVLPVIRVNRDPAAIDASLLGPGSNRYVLSSLLSLERETDQPVEMATLARLSLSHYLDLRETEIDEQDPVLLIFDQFEEILTMDPLDPEAKAQFFEQVADALRNRRRFALFAVREEYVGRLDPYLQSIPTQLSVRMRLDLLSKEAAQQAIQRPGPAGGGEELHLLTDNFTAEAAAELAEDLAQVRVLQPDADPLLEPGLYVEPVQLQVVCERLWGEAQERGESQVGVDALKGVGTVDDALAEYFGRKVKIIADRRGVPEWRIRRWFEHKLITAQGIRGLVMRGAGESEGLDNEVIEDLIETYLVRRERRRSITWFELAHDRLIEPVRQNNAAWQERKLIPEQRKANLWDEWGRPEGVFLRGKELANFENWVRDNKKRDPTWQPEPHEANFLNTSRARHKVERRQKILAIAIAVMFFLAVAATILSVIEADRARQEESRAEVALGTADAALSTADAALDMVAVIDSRARATSLAAATSESEAAFAEAAAVRLEQTLEAIGTPMTMTLELQQTVEVLQAAATATRTEADRLQGTAEAARTAEAAANQTAEAELDMLLWPKVDPRIQSLLTLDLKGRVYKLEEIIWMDPDESEDLHHIFVDVVDQQGKRLVGEQVRVLWASGEVIIPIEERLGEPWGGNFPMFGELGTYAVQVLADDGASDRVAGLGLGTPQEPNIEHQTSFGLRFVGLEPTPLPSDTPTATPSPTPTPSPTATATHLLLNGPMQVAGATSLETLTNRMVDRFRDATGYTPALQPEYIGTGPGFERFCVKNSEIDVVLATGAGRDRDYKERCGAAGRPLVGFQVAWRPADSSLGWAEREPLTLYTTPSTLLKKPQVAAFIRYYLENATRVITTDALNYEPIAASSRAGALQWLETLLQLSIHDLEGTERDWDWLIDTFGDVTLARGTGTAAVTALRAVEGPATLVVHVEDSGGNPLNNVPVVWHWPSAPELPSDMKACGLDRGVVGRTNSSGNIGFGMGTGDYYLPSSGQAGPSVVWIATKGTDCLGGLGMLGETNPIHLDSVWRMP